MKRISKTKSKNPLVRFWTAHFHPKKTLAIFLFLVFGGAAWAGTAWINNGGLKKTVVRVVNNLPVDMDKNGHVNVLLLGVAGKNEEGGNLSDSIMLVSVDPNEPSVSLLSLPRDLYMASGVGERKVNEIYAAARHKHGDKKGLDIAKKAIEDFTGIEVHYGAVINFAIFEEAIDALDGIKVFVPQDIVDPNYPDDNYGYQTFVIRKGNQVLNGATALKYARSRKTTSDYSRAQRQQDVLMAMKARAQELNLLTDLDKLGSLYSIYKDNINTDVSLTEAIAMAKIGTALEYKHVVSAVLNDDPLQKGGFLYAPAREFYGGQYVLLPESWKDTREFIRLTLQVPEILKENAQISVLNGSKIEGLAGDMGTRLRRFGFHVIETGNFNDSRPVFQSFYTVMSLNPVSGTTQFLEKFLGFESQELDSVISDEDLLDIQMVIGTTQEQ